MDLLKKQTDLARANVVALVRICGNVFALSRTGDALAIRKLQVRAHLGGLQLDEVAREQRQPAGLRKRDETNE